MKGRGLGYVICGAVGMMMSLVWFTLGGLFVASIMGAEKEKKKRAFDYSSHFSDNANYKPRSGE